MANINKLEMAKTLATRNDIKISSSLFGLFTTAVYTPTGSKLAAFKLSYAPDQQARLNRLLSAPDSRLAQVAAENKPENSSVGNLRIEGCVSADRAFMAVQLLQYQDYLYKPVDEPRFLTGETARAMAEALSF